MVVDQTCFDAEWPPTVESGTLSCDKDEVTFTMEGGPIYAVNGLADARGAGIDIGPIWADAPLDLKVDIGPLITAGLDHC